jgi:hypothetical protein
MTTREKGVLKGFGVEGAISAKSWKALIRLLLSEMNSMLRRDDVIMRRDECEDEKR